MWNSLKCNLPGLQLLRTNLSWQIELNATALNILDLNMPMDVQDTALGKDWKEQGFQPQGQLNYKENGLNL